MKLLRILIAALMLPAGFALAQNAPAPPPPQKDMIFLHRQGGGPGAAVFGFEMMEFHQVVKNAPYSATITTESTQVLGDGNRIVNKQTDSVARDSQGRTRRELTMGRMGPVQVNAPKVIFIHDPVAQTMTMLDPEKQTAHLMNHRGMGGKQMAEMHSKMHAQMMDETQNPEEKAQVTRESLGTQQIEGVTAEGTRVTRTIPAGTIGNERPIQITVESWTSPDLHVLVLQKRNDPRFGETVYRLTNIKRDEPDPTLFQVPSNFKVVQGGPPPVTPGE
jgi:hypothetical protein